MSDKLDGKTISVNYVGGLGQPSKFSVVKLQDDALAIRVFKAPIWTETIPFTSITGLAIETMDGHISAGRVLATGLIGLFWKKHDEALAVTFAAGGMTKTALFTGKRKELDALSESLQGVHA